jgi:acyl carrier protein
MSASAPLLGAIPELDSMAVVTLITALEEHFGITVADDEIGASTFETLDSLAQFIERKLPQ